MSLLKRLLFVCGLLVVLPASAFAQAAVTAASEAASANVLSMAADLQAACRRLFGFGYDCAPP